MIIYHGIKVSSKQGYELVMKKREPNSNLRRGCWGEDKACELLCAKGYLILDRNFRCKTGEIDIIAKKGAFIVFVEVKMRTRTDFGLPCQAVNAAKMRRLRLSAEFYLLKHPGLSRMQPRNDIIELLHIDGKSFIRHIENAF